MKRVLFFLSLLALLVGCQQQPETVVISGQAVNYEDSLLFVSINNVKDTILVNDDGTFSKEIKTDQPIYPNFQGNRVFAYLWIAPGKTLTIDFDGSNFKETVAFGGDLALPNQYLLEKTPETSANYRAINAGYRPPNQPEDFLRITDSVLQLEQDLLKAFIDQNPDLDTAFIRMEETAIQYSYLANLQNYPSRVYFYNSEVSIPDDWTDFMEGVVMDDPWLLTIPDAKYFVVGYVTEKALMISGIDRQATWGNIDLLRTLFDVVENEFMNPEMVDALLYEKLKQHMDARGNKDIEDLVARYLAVVQNEEHQKTIEDIDQQWNALKPGQPAPAFTVLDIDGNEHSLSDFHGQFVFIDFWATWCGPCIAQIPALEEIYHDYKDRNIAIMSISVDKNKEDWENDVREKNHPWLQFHDGTNMNDFFLVRFIPTFVLIGTDGNIIEPRAPYPSDQELRVLLDSVMSDE